MYAKGLDKYRKRVSGQALQFPPKKIFMRLTSVRRDGEDIPDSDGPLDHRLPHADVSNIT